MKTKKVVFQWLPVIFLLIISLYIDQIHSQVPNNQEPLVNPADAQSSDKGFQNIAWSTTYKNAKDMFRKMAEDQSKADIVQIVADDPDRSILTKQNGILYKYLFYKKRTPEDGKQMNILQKMNPEIEKSELKEEEENPARFFFEETSFPFVPADQLYLKLKEKYGKHTGSTLTDENRGAYIWESKDSYVIQWIEAYHKKPFTRKIFYLNKTLREEIMKDLDAYLNYKELKLIKDVLP